MGQTSLWAGDPEGFSLSRTAGDWSSDISDRDCTRTATGLAVATRSLGTGRSDLRGVTVGAESPRQNTGQSKHGQTWEKVGRRGKRLKCRFRVTSGGEWLVARGKGRVSGVEGWVSRSDVADE